MKIAEYITKRLPCSHGQTVREQGSAFAPSNIALVKYWGKRDEDLHLPLTDSLSISLDYLGSTTTLSAALDQDSFTLNGKAMASNSQFCKRLSDFLGYFRCLACPFFKLSSEMNIPISAGLASSACGYAALTEALNELFDWQLDKHALSQISRIGSGSASRSHWQGFVIWHSGHDTNTDDCYAEPITTDWHDLCVAILPNESTQKFISSREAMALSMHQKNVREKWQYQTNEIIQVMQIAIHDKNFAQLGSLAQQHANAMHAIMHQSQPAINYDTDISKRQKQQITQLQNQNHGIYYTQDAGPHIKVLFQAENHALIKHYWPSAITINPWSQHIE